MIKTGRRCCSRFCLLTRMWLRPKSRRLSQSQEIKQDEGLHVTFGDHKRTMSFNNDHQVEALRHQFLQVFSDVLGGQVAPAEVTFQRYHNGFQDFVDVSDDIKLEIGDKVKAIVRHCDKDKETSGAWFPGSRSQFHHLAYLPICFDKSGSPGVDLGRDPWKDHPIEKNTKYRLWSPLSRNNGGLIRLDHETNVVSCNGQFGAGNGINTVVTSEIVHKPMQGPLFYLVFSHPTSSDESSKWYMKENGEGNDITAEETNGTPSDEYIFEPNYYWSYTMFRSFELENLYLGCDTDGKATLVNIGDPSYPNPQVLFIVNKVNLDGM